MIADLEQHLKTELADSSEDGKPVDKHFERTLLLADLPNPDAGKTDEELAAIVCLFLCQS